MGEVLGYIKKRNAMIACITSDNLPVVMLRDWDRRRLVSRTHGNSFMRKKIAPQLVDIHCIVLCRRGVCWYWHGLTESGHAAPGNPA